MSKYKNQLVHFFQTFLTDIYYFLGFRPRIVNAGSRKKKYPSIHSFSLVALCIAAYFVIGFVSVQNEKLLFQNSSSALLTELKKELLRFHVIANSDSSADQSIKLTLKQEVLDYLSSYLSVARDKQEAMHIIAQRLPEITLVANNTLAEQGVAYKASASLCCTTFPVKAYGDITLPPGNYDALLIELGDAVGQNWWCIMYPQLCFIDETYAIIPEDGKNQLKQVLTNKEYSAIVSKQPEIMIRSKLLDWLAKLFPSLYNSTK